MNRARAIFGLALVAIGVIFFLDAMDILSPWSVIRRWWPVILIALGLTALLGRPRSLTGGGVLIAIGAVLLLATLDILDVALWQLIIAMLFISAGFSLVIRGFGGGGAADRSDDVRIIGVLSEQRVRSESMSFRQASLTSILGEVTLDLRNATLDPSGASVDAFCMLGDVKIIAPRGWRIHVNGIPVLGEFDDETEPQPDLPENAPELTITGVSLLADVDVRHG
jgi:predicted membrane protein